MMRSTKAVGGALVLVLAAGGGTASADTGHAGLRDALRRLTAEAGTPGALAVVRDRTGATEVRSGVGDLRRGTPVPPGSRFRIGSVTKTFTATVVLQLVGEGRVDLDAPIERYLPGLVRGNGNDGREITVRHLLGHRSGLPDNVEHMGIGEAVEHPLKHREPRELLGYSLAHPRLFKPGEGYKYSGANYVLAGLLIEKVTGRPYGEAVRRRLLRPLDLRGTSVPGDRAGIPAPHPRGYLRTTPGEQPRDYTRINPSVAWAAGEMISTAPDLNRFFAALVGGRLLRPAELRAMKQARPTGNPGGAEYGLGLMRVPLACGGEYWGHSGDILGFSTIAGATTGGRQATVMVNLAPGGTQAQKDGLRAAVTAALCGD
ncbi:serine hydrolase domain-containing protein [Actinomadura kijaniata]|uniref:D-alanyl-D-alanine carboxypeptidase n=1 Tax=Actinomadura namibiensis TaxID=182080 RepID=A0A7W3LVT9_ACTNM|nr:serine hydrolase domain-containing protein [Actinomadura namibiensis]MBA8955218.1 D-alanyl-D-alanine carboxypeptidase [Actinomadura namibiensis]